MNYSHITGEEVINEMLKVAEERPSFVYLGQNGGSVGSGCSYVGSDNESGTPHLYKGEGCIVGQALSRLGVSREDLIRADALDDSSEALFALPFLGIDVNQEQLGAINSVQRKQDAGLSWGDAVGPLMD